ncbi:MAG: siderophore-interacting protein [Pseudomonadota bacterium]
MSVTSEAVIEIPNPKEVLLFFMDHVRSEHDMEFETADDGSRYLELVPFRIELLPEAAGLRVRLHGPSHDALSFLKEDLVEHVSELDQEAARNIRWSGEMAQVGELPPNFKLLTVTGTHVLSQNLQRVTLAHEEFSSLSQGGMHVRLMLPLLHGREPIWPRMAENGVPRWPQGEDKLHARFVTIRHIRAGEGEIDVDIVRHHGGLISDWSVATTPGETVGMMGPAGVERLPSSGDVFLAADETGLPSVARLLETATTALTGHVVVAATDDLDLQTYVPKTNLQVERLLPESFRERVLDRALDVTEPKVTCYGYFAGEFENAQELRAMFKSRLGLDKTAQLSVAYWREGVPGFGS